MQAAVNGCEHGGHAWDVGADVPSSSIFPSPLASHSLIISDQKALPSFSPKMLMSSGVASSLVTEPTHFSSIRAKSCRIVLLRLPAPSVRGGAGGLCAAYDECAAHNHVRRDRVSWRTLPAVVVSPPSLSSTCDMAIGQQNLGEAPLIRSPIRPACCRLVQGDPGWLDDLDSHMLEDTEALATSCVVDVETDLPEAVEIPAHCIRVCHDSEVAPRSACELSEAKRSASKKPWGTRRKRGSDRGKKAVASGNDVDSDADDEFNISSSSQPIPAPNRSTVLQAVAASSSLRASHRQDSHQLPPGWTTIECTPSSGINYKRYLGPGGAKAQSIGKAWQKSKAVRVR